jgi:hypothetical protein
MTTYGEREDRACRQLEHVHGAEKIPAAAYTMLHPPGTERPAVATSDREAASSE